jgi:hypothetical protein
LAARKASIKRKTATKRKTAAKRKSPSAKRKSPSTRRKPSAKRKPTAKRRAAAKRELIATGTNKLYVRRNKRGTSFKEVVDVSRSLAADRRRKAKTIAKPGQGDRGDRRKR